ncbi:MAG: hypothetical protein JWL61_3739, partial [Gemmatimonadetes bacterium]|nr:hypothetical protein [Gemmatimonadota bacterium]
MHFSGLRWDSDAVRSAPWVLATRNAGKLRELRALFATHAVAVIDLSEAG